MIGYRGDSSSGFFETAVCTSLFRFTVEIVGTLDCSRYSCKNVLVTVMIVRLVIDITKMYIRKVVKPERV